MSTTKRYLISFIFLPFLSFVAWVNILKPTNFDSRLAQEHVLEISQFDLLSVDDGPVLLAHTPTPTYFTEISNYLGFESSALLVFSMALICGLLVYFLLSKAAILTRIILTIASMGLLVADHSAGVILIESAGVLISFLLLQKLDDWKYSIWLLAVVGIIWSFVSLSALLIPVVLVIRFLFKQRRDYLQLVASGIVIVAAVSIHFWMPKWQYAPSINPGFISEELGHYYMSGVLKIGLILSAIILLTREVSMYKKVVAVFIAALGLLFPDISILPIIPVLILLESHSSFQFNAYNAANISVSILLYFGVVALAQPSISNYSEHGVSTNEGVSRASKKLSRALKRIDITGPIFCLNPDFTEAKHYFSTQQIFVGKLDENEFIRDEIWAAQRDEFNFNAIFFNLKNKNREELIFLGERLEVGLWSLVYHAEGELAVLLRLNADNISIIRQFDITPKLQ